MSIDGPFGIICGSKCDKFLETSELGEYKILTITEYAKKASAFRVEFIAKNQFKILEEQGTDMYLATNVDHKLGDASIQVSKGDSNSITCTLGEEVGEEVGADIDIIKMWEEKACYVKIVSPRPGYLGYNEISELVEFIEDPKKEQRGSMWLKFKLERFKTDEKGNVIRGPNGPHH